MKINIIIPVWSKFMAGFNEYLSEEIYSLIKKTDNLPVITEGFCFVEDADIYICVAKYREEVRSEWLKSICRGIRKKTKSMLIVCGKAATESRKYLLRNIPQINFVINGEVEQALFYIIRNINDRFENFKGITYLDNYNIVETERFSALADYDLLPFPEFLYLNDIRYKIAVLISSRGCHGRCKFCEGNICRQFIVGSDYRAKSAERVVDELRIITKKFQRKIISFADDNFLVDGELGKVRAEKIAKYIVDNKINIRYTIECRSDDIEFELFRDLKRSGLCKVFVGIESGSQNFLERLGKGISIETNVKAIRILNELGIMCEPGYIFFDAVTSQKELEETLNFFKKFSSEFYSPKEGDGTNLLYYPYDSQLLKDIWPDKSQSFYDAVAEELIEYPFVDEKTRRIYKEYSKIIAGKPVGMKMLEWRLYCLEKVIRQI